MGIVKSSVQPLKPVSRWYRVRGVCAVLSVTGILATAIAAPLTLHTDALADDTFYERIHQQFVPETSELALDVSVSTLEKIPEPKPEPVASPDKPTSSSAPPKYVGGGSPAEWMSASGIPESEWGYVDFIVSKESGWNPNATNSSSGACGLVQALPCTKVPGGNGYDPIANLAWANGYATGRYGSWAQAYAFWTSNHWW